MDRTKKIESRLQQRIVLLRDSQNEPYTLLFGDDHLVTMKAVTDALQLAKHPRDVHRFLKCIGWVEDIIEIYIARGKEAKRQLISSLVEVFIDYLICEQTPVCPKMELSRIMNLILEGCSLRVAQELLKEDDFKLKIENLFSQIASAGDFEMQVMLIESILRLTPLKSLRETFFHKLVPDQLLFSSFLNIRDSHFDVDCRKFLNQCNGSNDSSDNRIYSFAVDNVKLDGEQLYKPDDEGYDDFWVDFNSGSKRISLFCQSTLLPSQLSQSKEPRWETLSLRASDIQRYNCEVKNKVWMVTVELKVNAQMLTNREREKQPHLFTCQLSQCYDVETALDATLKLKKEKSSVPQSLFLPQKIESSNSKHNIALDSAKLSDSTQSSTMSYSDRVSYSHGDSTQKKCSTPIEPLNIIFSSISSTDGSRHISWQAIHDRINQKNRKEKCSESSLKRNTSSAVPQSCKTGLTKNRPKCSVALTSAEIKSINVAKDASLKRRRNGNVQKLNELDDRQKRNNPSAKEQPMMPDAKIYQSPVTASGDFAFPGNKLKIPNLTEKKVARNNQKEKKSNVRECQVTLKESKASRRADNSSVEACDSGLQNSMTNMTEMPHKNSSCETDSSFRKPSLRSGEKVMTPVVSCKPISTKIEKQQVSQKNKNKTKMSQNSSERNLTDKMEDVNDKNAEGAAYDKSPDMKLGTCTNTTAECKLPNIVPVQNKDTTECKSFDGFKTPEAVDSSNNRRKSRRNMKGTVMNSVNQSSTEKTAKYSNRSVLNPSMNASVSTKEDNILDGLKFSESEHKKTASVSKLAEQEVVPSSKDDLVLNDLDQTDCASVAGSTGSFELCVETETSVTGDAAKELSQDVVWETQIDKPRVYLVDQQNSDNIDEAATTLSCNETLNNDKKDKDTCEIVSSSRQFNLSNDTQMSTSLVGSYIFKKNDNGKMDRAKGDCTALNAKKTQKQSNQDHHKPHETMKYKTDASVTKQNISGAEHVEECTKKKLAKDSETSHNKPQEAIKHKTDVPVTKQNPSRMEHVEQRTKKTLLKESETSHNKPHETMKYKTDAPVTKQNMSRTDHVEECTKTKLAKDSETFQKPCKAKQSKKDMSERNEKCKTTTNAIPESSPTVTSSIDVLQKPHGDSNEVGSRHGKGLSCMRNLRARNKDICYKECDSVNGNSIIDKHEVIKPSQPSKMNAKSKFDDMSFLSSKWMETSPPLSCVESNHDDYNHTNHFSSLKAGGSSQSYRIWRSQEIKTTVTSMPLNASDHRDSDPYDFNSECVTRLHDSNRFVPYKSGSQEKYNVTSNSLQATQKDKHRKSKKLSEPNQHVQNKISSTLTNSTTQVEFKKHIWKSTKVKSKDFNLNTWSGDAMHSMGKTSSALYSNSKTQRAFNVSTHSSHGKSHEKDNISPHHKMENALKASDSGLVFPPLKDSIPSTPFNYHENDENTIDSISRGTQLSWIAKAPTTPGRRMKMRGKTYGYDGKMYNEKKENKASRRREKSHTACRQRSDKQADENYRHPYQTYDDPDPIVSSDSPRESHARKLEHKRREKMQTSSPVLYQTCDGRKKTPKRKLSFGANCKERKRKKSSIYSCDDTISSIGVSFGSSHYPGSLLSSTAEYPSDKLPGLRPTKGLTFDCPIVSGPSSTQRLNKSALKRKYPSVSSDSVQDISSDSPPKANDPKQSRYLPRKLFDSEVTVAKASKKTRNYASSDEERVHHHSSNKWDTCDTFKEPLGKNPNHKVNSRPSKAQKMKTIPITAEKKVLKSMKSHKKISDEKYEPQFSSPEIARGGTKADEKSLVNYNKSDLDFQFSPGTHPASISSQEEYFGVNSPLNNSNNTSYHRSYNPKNRQTIDINSQEDGEYQDESNEDVHAVVQTEKSVVSNQVKSLSDVAQQIMNSANSIMSSSCTEGVLRRSKAMTELDHCLRSVIDKTDRLSQELKEAELKATLLLTQQLQTIKSYREFSEQSLESLKGACRALVNEVKEVHTNEDRVKKSVKAALKKDFDALTLSVKTKFNEPSLEAMRRSLQASFMML